MKKNYLINKHVFLTVLFLFALHVSTNAQTRLKAGSTPKLATGTNVSRSVTGAPQGGPITTVTTCTSPYIWPLTGQSFTASGIYTSNGITQGFNNQANWTNSVTGFNTTVAANNLGGLPNTNPINLTVGTTAVSMGAPNGMYTTGTFVGTNTATDVMTITLGPGVYGFSANIYATNISDAVTTGDITVTYSTGFVDARTVTSASEFFGYTSTTPITSVTITCANTVAPFKWPTINNLALATNASATLDLTIDAGPVTTNFNVCQGGTVTGGLTSTLSPGFLPLPNYTGNNTGGPTYNRPTAMNQGGVCANSAAGTAVQYGAHTFTAPTTGAYEFSTCGGATFDTFLALYQAPFNPAGLCAGNTLVAASDDVCGAQSTITANLTVGTSYVLVFSGFTNTEAGPYTITSTTPAGPIPSVEWYTSPTGGTAIATGSPFNPVGVTGSGITNTNTPGMTPFYAQFPGSSCRVEAQFTITANATPTFVAVAPICTGATLNALPTTSTNGVTGTWTPALNNTATTTYTFTPTTGQCATTATLQIVVNPLPIITCPSDITVCQGQTVNYAVTSNVSTGPVTLTQNTSNVAVAGVGLGCNPGGDNAFYRVFDLAALGYTSNLTLNNIKFSVEATAVDRVVTVSAYTLTGAMNTANLSLLGSNTVTALATAPALTNYTVSMGGLTVPGGSTLVISYAVASSVNNGFLPGSNALGQSSPVYIRAADCGIPQPVTLASVGFPNVHVILEAELTQGGSLVQTAGLPSGSVFPVGTTTVTHNATNGSGCSTICSFNVTVNPSAATPTGSTTQSFPVLNTNDATIANIVVNPTNVIWYGSLADAQVGINALPTTTVLTNGATYYAVNASGICPSIPFGVTVTVTLGNEAFDTINFSYSPNPTSSVLNISYSKEINEVYVTNLLGQTVLNKKTSGTEVQIDLSPLSEATYFVTVISDGNQKTVKVIKKN